MCTDGLREPRALRIQPEGLGLDFQTVEAPEHLCVIERHDHIPVSEEPFGLSQVWGARGRCCLSQ